MHYAPTSKPNVFSTLIIFTRHFYPAWRPNLPIPPLTEIKRYERDGRRFTLKEVRNLLRRYPDYVQISVTNSRHEYIPANKDWGMRRTFKMTLSNKFDDIEWYTKTGWHSNY